MEKIRKEIYDDNGLVKVEFVDVEGPTVQQLIADKEAQLIAIYQEIQVLKGK
jgi:hypothetical protein